MKSFGWFLNEPLRLFRFDTQDHLAVEAFHATDPVKIQTFALKSEFAALLISHLVY